jgi:CRP-like cAMP-binding protein
VLAQDVVPEALYIIESGVVSASVLHGDIWLEVGRMGPGELIGESGFVDQTPTVARFCAYTDCMIYRIDRAALEPWLQEHAELIGALAGLQKFRAKARASMLESKPQVVDRNGFVGWLRSRVKRFQGPRPDATDKLS